MDECRTHICPKPGCGRGFTKKNNLTVYIQTVRGEKRFVCGAVDPRKLNKIGHWDGAGACGTLFTSKSNFEDHIRIAHLGLQRTQKRKCTTEEDDIADNRPPPKKAHISSLLRLTGSGYENKSGRYIPACSPAAPTASCAYVTLRSISPIAMASSMLKSNLYSLLEPTQTIRPRKSLQVLALMVLPITLPLRILKRRGF